MRPMTPIIQFSENKEKKTTKNITENIQLRLKKEVSGVIVSFGNSLKDSTPHKGIVKVRPR